MSGWWYRANIGVALALILVSLYGLPFAVVTDDDPLGNIIGIVIGVAWLMACSYNHQLHSRRKSEVRHVRH